jgi:CHAT domain-containing protein/Tfp pilus assembly protein PilF
MREKALGAKHPVVGASCNNLAETYRSMGEFAKAAPYYERAITIAEEAFGKEHPNVTSSLNNLGMLYKAQGDYAKAEPLLVRTLAIREKTLGKEHPTVAVSLGNLAGLYYEKGEYDKAEPLLLRALAIREKAFGSEHPMVILSLNNLANFYAVKGDSKQAITYQSRCNEATDSDLSRNLVSGSERQKLLYINQSRAYLDLTLSLHTRYAPNDAAALQAAVAVLLQRKGRAMDAMADTVAALRRRATKEDQGLLDQLVNARSQLSVVTLRGPGRAGIDKYKANLKSLADEVERLENEIAQRSAEFRPQFQKVTITAVQNAIPAGAVLVDFALYQQTGKQGEESGKLHYVAYVLSHHGQPRWVELGEAQAIDKSISRLRQALRDKRRMDVKRLARVVDRKMMQPVRSILVGELGNKGVGEKANGRTANSTPPLHIFLSPDGALNLIPFAALVDERGDYLVKRYSFTYLTSGRDLLRLQNKVPSRQVAVVMADADFNGNAENKTAGSDSTRVAQRINAVTGPIVGEVKFEPLKRLVASSEEAAKVKEFLPNTTVWLRNEATESQLKQVSRPSILHIATHGFFLDEVAAASSEKTRLAVRKTLDEEVPDDLKIANPLLRSGLFLAGANLGRSGVDDGTLTALEAAGLDLYGTKLVVLSACDTGVGEVKNGDGVYGLRRALVLAGSESQMMSLWAVSDKGTQELMVDYYKRLKAGEGRSEALRNVQLKMLTEPKRRHPFYWASFIQSGEWANLDGKRE